VGDHDSAVALFEAVLARRELVLGVDHPDTRVTRSDLAAARPWSERP
jgi:hypothetical protein